MLEAAILKGEFDKLTVPPEVSHRAAQQMPLLQPSGQHENIQTDPPATTNATTKIRLQTRERLHFSDALQFRRTRTRPAPTSVVEIRIQ